MVALKLQQFEFFFQFFLRDFGAQYFPCLFFVKVTPPHGVGIKRGGGG